VKEAGVTSVAPVRIGLRDNAYAEIVRGLNEGDTIVITYQAAQTQTSFFGGQMQGMGTTSIRDEMPPIPSR